MSGIVEARAALRESGRPDYVAGTGSAGGTVLKLPAAAADTRSMDPYVRCVRRARVGLLWVALAVSLPCAVQATGAAVGDGLLAPELLLFDEPMVTAASKHPQAARDAPSAVTVITREEIRRLGYRTLAEALSAQPGFYKSHDRLYETVGVRGFLRPGDYNDRVLLLVNGHRYNDDIYFAATVGNNFGIDMEAIERIEIVRGPGSALYGASALFAVVNVITVSPTTAPGVQLLAETGSFERKRGYASLARVFENGLELYATGSLLDVDGHEDLYFQEFDTPQTNNGIAHEGDDERAGNSFLSARYKDFFFQAGYQSRSKEDPTAAWGVNLNDDGTRVTDSRAFSEVVFERDVLPDVGITARAFYDHYDYRGTYKYGWEPNIDDAVSNWFGGELRSRWRPFEGNTLTVGAEAAYHPETYQGNYDSNSWFVYLDETRSYNNWGSYLQDEWALMPSLDLVAGVRYDRYYDQLGELSPRGALIWRPLERTTVKLLVGQAFRAPNLYELYYAAPGDPEHRANPDLEPETITTYEAVLERRLSSGASGQISIYNYDMGGLIDIVEIDGGRTTQFRNLDEVKAKGMELELRIPFKDRFSLRTSYSLQEARVDGERLLSNSPKHLGQVSFLFPLPARSEGGVEFLVVGPRQTLAGRQVDTAHVLNFTVRLPLIRGFGLSGSVYNLFDQRYFDPGGTQHRQDQIQQDGRTFRVQLGYAF